MTAVQTRRRYWILAAALAGLAAVMVIPVLARQYGVWSQDEPPTFANVIPNFRTRETATDEIISALQQRVRDDPKDYVATIGLANAYLQKARETGDPSLYAKSDDLLEKAEKLGPAQAELYATRAQVALARHDFSGALQLGRQALVLNPESAAYYGIVGDAQIELGMYDQAIDSYQKMIDRRPDFSSYARVAYARELYGDPEGAIEAMEFAIEAGSVYVENVAWAHVQLGNLWFSMGNLKQATTSYDTALKNVPDYASALAGQARLAAVAGDLTGAAELYGRAFDLAPLPEYAIARGDVFSALGDQANSTDQYELVLAIDKLFQANGVNTDLEIALFYADHDRDLEQSVAKARSAYQARPSVHAADVLGWTLYKAGNYQEAQRYANEALKLGTRDSLKLFHAGMIALALDQRDKAQEYLRQAINFNPHFSLLYSELAASTLARIEAESAGSDGGGAS